MKVEIRNTSFISSINYGNICPACPKVIVIVEYPNRYESLQESGTLVLWMHCLVFLARSLLALATEKQSMDTTSLITSLQ